MASIRFANCMELPLGTYGITACRVFPFLSVLIPYNAIGIDSILADARFHTATSCGFHTTQCVDYIHGYTVIWYERTRRITIAKRNLLLEYSEELAIKIVKLCAEYKIDSNTVFQIKNLHRVFLPIYQKRNIPKALQTCFQNLKLRVRNA